MPGIGTRISPITIDLDDSEDEVQYNLTADTAAGSSNSGSPVMHPMSFGEGSGHQDPTRSTFVELQETMKTSFAQLENILHAEDYPGSSPNGHLNSHKRKRSFESEHQAELPPPKHVRTQLEDRLTNPGSSSSAPPNPPPKGPQSKSAKKRHNKAEKNKRIQAENLRRLQRDFPPHHPALVPHYPPGFEPGDPINPFMLLRFNQVPPDHPDYIEPPRPQFVVPLPNPTQSMGVVTQTALAPPQPMQSTSTQALMHSQPPEPDDAPPGLPPPPTASGRPIPTGPKADMQGLSTKPISQVHLPIGMKPDQDPNSKHGIFPIIIHDPARPYQPIPARTLVMEQLPKTHRNAEFINNWARKATGALPLKVIVDTSAAKALVEFSTGELARKAWESPRLGSIYAGLKSHQLKGKPREDLIRVWWYRVEGVGAGSGVGEIEEGEIEGDAHEPHDAEVAPRKETKKEKRARLAKAREEKARREHEARMENPGAAVPLPNQAHMPLGLPPPLPPGLPQFSAFNPVLGTMPWAAPFASRPQVQIETSQSMLMNGIPGLSINMNMNIMNMDVDGEDMEIASPSEPPSPSFTSPSFPNHAIPSVPPSSASSSTFSGLATASELSPVSTAISESRSTVEDVRLALAARQKELQDQISQRRRDLADMKISTNAVATPQASAVQHTQLENRLDLLRQRVLMSKGAKQEAAGTSKAPPVLVAPRAPEAPVVKPMQASSVPVPPRPPVAPAVKPVEVAVPQPPRPPVPPVARPVTVSAPQPPRPPVAPVVKPAAPPPALTLEALAVSFITDTINTAKDQAKASPTEVPKVTPPPPPPRIPSNSKADYALKMKRLDEHIKQTKLLMQKMTEAKTKEERNLYMAKLKELDRQRSEEEKEEKESTPTNDSGPQVPRAPVNGAVKTAPPKIAAPTWQWPRLEAESYVMILSDDEDEYY